ncbi:MAG: right-handed parallel beta-helix repeat-containing protein [Methylocella sp.]
MPSTSSSFSVSNTIVSNNGLVGIFVQPTGSAVVTSVLSKVVANNNFEGIFVGGSATTGASLNVTIVDSEASNNGGRGVFANSASGAAPTSVMLRNVVVSNNGTGLDAEGSNATLRVGHSVITGNTFGVGAGGGILDSYADNDIDGNTTNSGVLTTIPTH